MMSENYDLTMDDDLPVHINPYKILEVEKKASADEVRSAYRKLALKHHPDKVPDDQKEQAKEAFQQISFAYGILSDTRRRSRYDTTGRTENSAHLDDEDDFDWSDFFRSQFAEVVSANAIDKFKGEYQGSDEERLDLISAYINNEGDVDAIFGEVMLSSPLEDEDRFRAIIDEEIKEKRVEAFPAYTKETKAKRKKRHVAAKKEAREAEGLAEELGVKDKLFGKGANRSSKERHGSGDDKDMAGLQALIQQRQQSRAENFLADLEAKYAPKGKRGKAGGKGEKGRAVNEPPEQAFERNSRTRKNVEAEEPQSAKRSRKT